MAILSNIFTISTKRRPDLFLFILISLLIIIGLIVLVSASSDLGKTKFDDSYYYLKHQLSFGFLLGFLGFTTALLLNYQIYRKMALALLVITILLLALVFTPLGPTIRNTNRWVKIGFFSFQPAEVVKLTFIIYIAAWLTGVHFTKSRTTIKSFFPFLTVSGIVAFLLVMQPATSTVVIILASAVIMYFISGAPLRYIAILIAIAIIGFSILIYTTPYRLQRITTFLHSGNDTQGAGYHINQALIAIGSGRLVGIGYGQSTNKINYLPTPIDDSIFAIAAQELGFIGSSVIISLFILLIGRLFWLAHRTKEKFGKFLLVGFASIIALQSITHIASISGVLPLTGIPLPFISYGGTALAVFLTMMGICLNISRN